jgi:hypothetical protein
MGPVVRLVREAAPAVWRLPILVRIPAVVLILAFWVSVIRGGWVAASGSSQGVKEDVRTSLHPPEERTALLASREAVQEFCVHHGGGVSFYEDRCRITYPTGNFVPQALQGDEIFVAGEFFAPDHPERVVPYVANMSWSTEKLKWAVHDVEFKLGDRTCSLEYEAPGTFLVNGRMVIGYYPEDREE